MESQAIPETQYDLGPTLTGGGQSQKPSNVMPPFDVLLVERSEEFFRLTLIRLGHSYNETPIHWLSPLIRCGSGPASELPGSTVPSMVPKALSPQYQPSRVKTRGACPTRR